MHHKYSIEVMHKKRTYVSFSEIHDWLECPKRHKIKYIDGVKIDEPNIHTIFGTTIHNAAEEYVTTRKSVEAAKFVREFEQEMAKYFEEYKPDNREELEKQAKQFAKSIPRIVEDIPPFVEETFPGWKLVAAEHALNEEITPQESKKFKGFVDFILKVDVRDNTRKKYDYEYVAIDWKSSSWGWTKYKKRDTKKQMQLVLYKKFIAEKFNLKPEQVKTGFVLLKRDPSKKATSSCELIPVSAGPKAKQEAENTIKAVTRLPVMNIHPKNRRSCRFCPYFNTEHCL